MNRRPRVVVIALDGMDPATVRREIAAGSMPALSKVCRAAREAGVHSDADLFLVSIWPCFASGLSVGKHGLHAFRPLKSGTLEFVDSANLHVPTPFWETAVRAGLRACVVDAPFCAPPPGDAALEGLRFLEWGAHPPLRPPGSFPRALASTIVDRYGLHPCTCDDLSLSSVEELNAVRRRICDGVLAREKVILHLLDQEPPDLLVATFSEGHVAGHQFLGLDSPGYPCHDPAMAAALGESPLRLVHKAIDASVGRILERLSPETTVLVACFGGVRMTYGGAHLLEDVLLRSGLAVAAPHRRKEPWSFVRLLPAWLRKSLSQRLPALVTRYSAARFRASLDWTATRAFALPGAYDGYLRINQRGREPPGIVMPGRERAALLDEIESMVRELKISGTDESAVREVVRAQEAYPGPASAELPDLMVLWRNDRPLDAVESPRLGRIENRDLGRRSAHTTKGGLFAYGPGIAAGPCIAGGRDIDIAPTVLELLGVIAPDDLDGRSLTDLLQRADAACA